MKPTIIFIANNNIGNGLSGGDRIFVELIRHWKKISRIILFGSEETMQILHTAQIEGIELIQTDVKNLDGDEFSTLGLFIHQIRRTWKGVFRLISHRTLFTSSTSVYAVSDFLPDVLPAVIAKILYKSHWIAALYFFAAKPFSNSSPYKGFAGNLRGLMYYLSQRITYFLIFHYADFTILCNELDRFVMRKDGYKNKNIFTIYGGVDLAIPNSISKQPIRFDAVFMARFHPQKGPVEAVLAWHEVVKAKSNTKLAMIGNGQEESKVKDYIKKHRLEKNIILLGFLDGIEKYTVLKSARLFIHPAIYETGGMAAAEGMASGLPVVAFDHKGFDYIYPYGMTRVSPIGDTTALAHRILELLDNKKEYDRLKQEAITYVQDWDWKHRAHLLYDKLFTHKSSEAHSG